MPQGAGGTGIVIVGGAMAGGNAAVTLREEGYRDRVAVVGQEPGIPFGRPPLSKTYLRSEEELAGWYVRPVSWYAEHDVDRLVGSSAAVIDTAAHTVLLGSGQELPYQKVLIATGDGTGDSIFRGLICLASTTCARSLSARPSSAKRWRAGARW